MFQNKDNRLVPRPPPPPSSFSMPPFSRPLSNNNNRKWAGRKLSSIKRKLQLPSSAPPLPPDLLPSPPPSRHASPLPSFKRKSDSNPDTEHAKRPRTNATFHRSTYQHSQLQHSYQPHHPRHPSSQHQTPSQHIRNSSSLYSTRLEPPEDGEVPEDTAVASTVRSLSAIDASFVPVRRPRRGRPPSNVFDQLHDQYYSYGRLLKYSGDRRIWSTFPATHKEYRPLVDPPPLNSPYHKFGPLIARLELLDALVCFTYSIWNRDYARRTCYRDTWATIEAFLTWCKHKWSSEDTIGDREKAFIGLIWMIQGFITSRKLAYQAKHFLDPEMDKMIANGRSLAYAAAEKVMDAEATQAKSVQSDPPMLPSPASIAHSNSANSTPIGSTNDTSNPAHEARPQISSMPTNLLPGRVNGKELSASAMDAAAAVTLSITPTMAQALKDQSGGVVSASLCMTMSQQTLTLPVMSQHFPLTFSRMINSSLLSHEEHEPDIEDQEGELFWPGQSATGEGLGWVCLMAKAMIKEFGKDIGYRGLDGVIPKPKVDEHGPGTPASSSAASQGPTRPGTVTSTIGTLER